MLDNRSQALVVASAGAAYVILWIFLAGGILDRYARNRPTRAGGFFGRCGVFFFRFLRLGRAGAAGVLAPLRLRARLALRNRVSVGHP